VVLLPSFPSFLTCCLGLLQGYLTFSQSPRVLPFSCLCFRFRKTPLRDVRVVRVLPLLQGDGWASLSLSLHFQSYSQGAVCCWEAKSHADPKLSGFLPCLFSACPHAISLQAVVPEALAETKESHSQSACWLHPVPSPSRSQPHQWM